MVTGCCRVDLTTEPDMDSNYGCDRRALGVLDGLPDGARVVVHVSGRTYISSDAALWLHRHSDRLLIEIQGAGPEISAWLQAASTGQVGAFL